MAKVLGILSASSYELLHEDGLPMLKVDSRATQMQLRRAST